MIHWMNAVSQVWVDYIVLLTLQNSLFLCGVFAALYLLRRQQVVWLRAVALIGLLKLFVVPVISTPSVEGLPAVPFELVDLGWPAAPVEEPRQTLSGSACLMLGWLGTAVALLGRTWMSAYRLRRRFRQARPVEVHPAWAHDKVTVVQSSWDHSPLVFGLFKPCLVLPACWDSWSAPCQRVVMAHELAHIRQGDPWIYLAQTTAQALFFFNPLVWLLNQRLSQYSEMACDDAAVAGAAVSKVTYTEHLLYVAQSVTMSSRMQPAHLAVSAAYHSLRRRIEYQLSRRGVNRTSTAMRWGVIALLIMAMFPLSWDLTSWRSSEAIAKGRSLDMVPTTSMREVGEKSLYQPFLQQQPILYYGSGGCI